MKKIRKYLNIITYYILISLGLIITSWIIWSRFIRERTIRKIPDDFFTEYRFWILFYISFIYLYAVKNLVKPSTSGLDLTELVNLIFKPLTTLDHAIKYNQFVKPYYYKIMFKLAIFMDSLVSDYQIKIIMFFIQIFPRIILVIFLLLDILYFERLEIFYKIVLIGLIPLLYRYFKYSCKDIYEQWIITLEDKYNSVTIYEEGYEFDKAREDNTEAIYHNKRETIRKYIEIKFENTMNNVIDYVKYKYNHGLPHCKDDIIDQYCLDKYNKKRVRYTVSDLDNMSALYYELMPNILKMKLYLYRLDAIAKTPPIKWPQVVIFSIYFICWSYILVISYMYYPIELNGAKYLLLNFMRYLCDIDNPFAELYWGSLNENLITKEEIKNVLYKILKKIFRL
jgi:hypothetical protein